MEKEKKEDGKRGEGVWNREGCTTFLQRLGEVEEAKEMEEKEVAGVWEEMRQRITGILKKMEKGDSGGGKFGRWDEECGVKKRERGREGER